MAETDWRDPAWLTTAVRWIDETLAGLRLRRTGAAEQTHVRPWSTVLRIPTADGGLWFKANGPGTAYEPALLDLLGRLVPSYVIVPLAVDRDMGWSLSPDGGPTLRASLHGEADPARWERILPSYADLQQKLSGQGAELIAAGVPDLRPERVPARLDRLLDDLATLPAGRADAIDPAVLRRLREVRPAFSQWCDELAGSGIPATLEHSDLHDGNVFAGPDGYRLFDWGDASVAHPFGTLLVTLRSLAYRAGLPADAPELARVRDAYLEAWTGRHSLPDLAATAATAIRVATVSRALAWERALVGAAPEDLAEYGAAVAGWLAELLAADVP